MSVSICRHGNGRKLKNRNLTFFARAEVELSLRPLLIFSEQEVFKATGFKAVADRSPIDICLRVYYFSFFIIVVVVCTDLLWSLFGFKVYLIFSVSDFLCRMHDSKV